MNIVIINNHTTHIIELQKLFPDSIVIEKENLDQYIVSDFDHYNLIVLSGGSGHIPPVFSSPEQYVLEIDLVTHTTAPVLGICLGAEIIAHSYGAELTELDHKISGNRDITITDSSLIEKLRSNILSVYEGHRIAISELPECLVSLAYSTTGHEIIKHTTKPILGLQFHPEMATEPYGFLQSLLELYI